MRVSNGLFFLGGSVNRRRFLQAAASLPLASPIAGALVTPVLAEAMPFEPAACPRCVEQTVQSA